MPEAKVVDAKVEFVDESGILIFNLDNGGKATVPCDMVPPPEPAT